MHRGKTTCPLCPGLCGAETGTRASGPQGSLHSESQGHCPAGAVVLLHAQCGQVDGGFETRANGHTVSTSPMCPQLLRDNMYSCIL